MSLASWKKSTIYWTSIISLASVLFGCLGSLSKNTEEYNWIHILVSSNLPLDIENLSIKATSSKIYISFYNSTDKKIHLFSGNLVSSTFTEIFSIEGEKPYIYADKLSDQLFLVFISNTSLYLATIQNDNISSITPVEVPNPSYATVNYHNTIRYLIFSALDKQLIYKEGINPPEIITSNLEATNLAMYIDSDNQKIYALAGDKYKKLYFFERNITETNWMVTTANFYIYYQLIKSPIGEVYIFIDGRTLTRKNETTGNLEVILDTMYEKFAKATVDNLGIIHTAYLEGNTLKYQKIDPSSRTKYGDSYVGNTPIYVQGTLFDVDIYQNKPVFVLLNNIGELHFYTY